MRPRLALFLLAALWPALGRAASLDINTDYRLRGVSYTNLNLQDPRNDRSFMTQNGRLAVVLKDAWRGTEGNDEGLDLGVALRGIGVAGSTTAVQVPFDRAASYYPNTSFTPFFENAYVRLKNVGGYPWETTIGQQNFKLGSGLLLSDDGAGFTGVSVLGSLPLEDMKAGAFVFQPRNQQAGANSLMVYGGTIELPTEGTWQLNELVEKDQSPQMTSFGLPINKATRYFTSARYQIAYGPIVFDGEGAIERGSAVPNPADGINGNILYKGDAEVMRAKWRQPLPARMGEGIGRITVSRGSGYSGRSVNSDEAFFPSHGHRFDGLERDGYGEFFAATPYDAFGGASSSTVSGMPAGLTGIETVGIGFTPPAFYGIALDIDHYLYQADRNTNGPSRSLGQEWDARLRYRFRDKLSFAASAAYFTTGDAMPSSHAHGRRYLIEAAARF